MLLSLFTHYRNGCYAVFSAFVCCKNEQQVDLCECCWRSEAQTEEVQCVDEHAQDVAHQLNKSRKIRHAPKRRTICKAFDAEQLLARMMFLRTTVAGGD
jgi:hypothetical protein